MGGRLSREERFRFLHGPATSLDALAFRGGGSTWRVPL